ncbi:hypothetical protein vBPpSSYP_205 [Pseudomonas phage vB_PpS_SYP]|nr:hypothetical protein vBPpSSYP_205 [Pseudomonas phage vB_PpS_SYP]
MEIQRHFVCASGYGEGYLVPHPLGEAVEYDDHIEVVNELQRKIDDLEMEVAQLVMSANSGG